MLVTFFSHNYANSVRFYVELGQFSQCFVPSWTPHGFQALMKTYTPQTIYLIDLETPLHKNRIGFCCYLQ